MGPSGTFAAEALVIFSTPILASAGRTFRSPVFHFFDDFRDFWHTKQP
jgi:hypothetical protein